MKKLHQYFMQMALSLSVKGKGHVSPNPLVGCVIVKDNKVVAAGAHLKFGGPHAEINALKIAGQRAKGASMYLTLEPCSHIGKTGPCAPALIEAGIKTVYIAIKDPNPLVKGKGIRQLQKAGIKVHMGLEKNMALHINKSFIKWKSTGLPYVIFKSAMTLDGKIASRDGNSKWISSPQSRNLSIRLRRESDAILIGANTAQIDNPALTSHGTGRNPLRVIIDPTARLSPSLKCFSDREAKTLLIVGDKVKKEKLEIFIKKGIIVEQLICKKGEINSKDILRCLSKHNVSQVIIEGGGNTAWEFIKNKMVDKVQFFIAPILLGGKEAITPIEGFGFSKISHALQLKSHKLTTHGKDILIEGYL